MNMLATGTIARILWPLYIVSGIWILVLTETY